MITKLAFGPTFRHFKAVEKDKDCLNAAFLRLQMFIRQVGQSCNAIANERCQGSFDKSHNND